MPKLKIVHRKDLTAKQIDFMKLSVAAETQIVFAEGPAGSSKTFLAVYAALQLLNHKKCSRILYVRSTAESAAKSLGFLPGDLGDKFQPFLTPLLDKLDELLPPEDAKYLLAERLVTGIPVNYLRGASLEDTAIIIDEAQNLTAKELITILTRIGHSSRCFLVADVDQSDIGAGSGFSAIMDLFDDEESRAYGVRSFRFGEEDIVRSEIVKFMVGKFKSLRK